MASEGHRCYFADPSGGFGWPSCVICGAPVSIQESAALRPCCQTRENADHLFTCQSVDARQRKGLSPFPTP